MANGVRGFSPTTAKPPLAKGFTVTAAATPLYTTRAGAALWAPAALGAAELAGPFLVCQCAVAATRHTIFFHWHFHLLTQFAHRTADARSGG